MRAEAQIFKSIKNLLDVKQARMRLGRRIKATEQISATPTSIKESFNNLKDALMLAESAKNGGLQALLAGLASLGDKSVPNRTTADADLPPDLGQCIVSFCINEILTKLVSGARLFQETQDAPPFGLTSVAHETFAQAHVIVQLCTHFEHLHLFEVLMAVFHEKCCYTACDKKGRLMGEAQMQDNARKLSSVSDEEFAKMDDAAKAVQRIKDLKEAMGYEKKTGGYEGFDPCSRRMRNYVALMTAVFQTIDIRTGAPYKLGEAWAWLARLLNSASYSVFTGPLLTGFLDVGAYQFSLVYKNQFRKVMLLLETQVLQRLDNDPLQGKASHRWLTQFLEKCKERNYKLEHARPKGMQECM